jgi:formylglycine-generating enzyme required for sulfatase activity
MAVKLQCPNPDCQASYNVDPAYLGRSTRCKKCGRAFKLGDPKDSSPAAARDGATSAPKELTPGMRFGGRYDVRRMLGRGGMGAVYLAHDTQLKRDVALKIPHLDVEDEYHAEVIRRFLREARAAARLDHPNICPIHDVGQVDGYYYLTMAYIEGEPLSSLLAEGPLPEARAAEVVLTLARALSEAHRHGVVHRDLKPSNIQVSPCRGLVIMDFGLARGLGGEESRITKAGQLLGTPAYMAPEQVRGDVKAMGPGCDIYSLGVILYELLTGRLPFTGPVIEVLAKVLTKNPDPPSRHRPGLDRQIEAICLKAMAKAPANRYATMADFATALEGYAGRRDAGDGRLKEAIVPGKPVVVRGWPSRRWGLAAALGAAALLFLGVIIYVVTDRGTVKIVVNDPSAVVRVDGEVIRIDNLDALITLRTGIHDLEVKHGDLEVVALKFSVRRGGFEVVNVSYAPRSEEIAQAGRPQPPTTPEPVPAVEPPKVADREAPSPTPPTPKAEVAKAKPADTARPDPSLKTWTNSLGMKFVRIQPGEFSMGSTENEDEKPPHLVKITRPFYLGDREVTQGQYQAVMGENPSHFKGSDDLPVEEVSWLDAVSFCNKLGEKEGRTPCYRIDGDRVSVVAGNGYRLPTEAEWEYACRAGSTTRYPFGDNEAELGEYAWFDGNAGNKTHPVGQKRPNRWGLYDMLGSVWEWCQDGYDAGYYATSPPADPPGPSGAPSRVFRGGSWYLNPTRCCPAYRGRFAPVFREDFLGFRLAAVRAE